MVDFCICRYSMQGSQAFFVDDVIVVKRTYSKGRGMCYMTNKTNHKECPCSRKSEGARDKLLQKKIKIIGPSSGKIQHFGGGEVSDKLCIVYYIFHGRVLQLGILDKFFFRVKLPMHSLWACLLKVTSRLGVHAIYCMQTSCENYF